MSLIDIKVPNIGDFAEVGVIELLVNAGDPVSVDQSSSPWSRTRPPWKFLPATLAS